MLRYGHAPFLECSTRGDKRFSAFCAIVDGQSIEVQYQAAKRFGDGSTGLSWREAKGRDCTNREEVTCLYSRLWDAYIVQHPELLAVLKAASGVSDMFGKAGSVCQATELWRIRGYADGGLITKPTLWLVGE